MPPLEVTSTPLCEKHLALYRDEAGNPTVDYTELTVLGVPAASFDEGRTLEIYTGTTTITIFGLTADLTTRAARALRVALPEDVPVLGTSLYALNEAADSVPAITTLPPPDQSVLAQTEPCR